jgi:hypothetical protein
MAAWSEPERFDPYLAAMDELGTPTHMSGADFADLYEHVTQRFDTYEEQVDMMHELRAMIADRPEVAERQRPRVGPAVEFGITALQMDVRGFVFVLNEYSVDWSAVRAGLAGGTDTWLDRNMVDLEDWVDFQSFLLETDYAPTYRQVRNWIGFRFYGRKLTQNEPPHGRVIGPPHGRVIGALVARFGGVCFTDAGSPVDWGRKKS